MKKIDLVHTTILIIALLAGYSALQQILGLLSSIAYISEMYYMKGGALGPVIFYLLSIALYSVACVVLIRKGRTYAAAILKDEPETSWEDVAAPITNFIDKNFAAKLKSDS